jgi:hypothetical protein
MDDSGTPLAYGVIADISERGGCVLTDARLNLESTLEFRVSFARPPEMYAMVGHVVWARDSVPGAGEGGRRYGIQWVATSPMCRRRLREMASRAVPPPELSPYRFQKPWTVMDV